MLAISDPFPQYSVRAALLCLCYSASSSQIRTPSNSSKEQQIPQCSLNRPHEVMGMHFKLGLYEHQSAGALEGAISALAARRCKA